ncbi:MAG: bacillithiol system redox-active protein YtxJ [Bacteroidota bacterium]
MGIFNTLFGNDQPKKEKVNGNAFPWVALDNTTQLDAIQERSHETPQLIFKHSTTCGISRMVLNMFTGSFDVSQKVDLYLLDLLSHRDVSNAVASHLGVFHESPQLLIIKNGEVVFHTSHGAIADTDLSPFL